MYPLLSIYGEERGDITLNRLAYVQETTLTMKHGSVVFVTALLFLAWLVVGCQCKRMIWTISYIVYILAASRPLSFTKSIPTCLEVYIYSALTTKKY